MEQGCRWMGIRRGWAPWRSRKRRLAKGEEADCRARSRSTILRSVVEPCRGTTRGEARAVHLGKPPDRTKTRTRAGAAGRFTRATQERRTGGFGCWLSRSTGDYRPRILGVCFPGGVGKTAFATVFSHPFRGCPCPAVPRRNQAMPRPATPRPAKPRRSVSTRAVRCPPLRTVRTVPIFRVASPQPRPAGPQCPTI